MTNRLAVAMIVILGFGMAGIVGYILGTQNEATDTAPIPRAMSSETEAMELSAASEPTPRPPQVFETTITVPYYMWLDQQAREEALDKGTFRFQVEGGSRVQTKVSLQYYVVRDGAREDRVSTTRPQPVFCYVRDPFGNVVQESSRRGVEEKPVSTQDYPWEVAFIAATSGEYGLVVLTQQFPLSLSGDMVTLFDAQLKVMLYEE